MRRNETIIFLVIAVSLLFGCGEKQNLTTAEVKEVPVAVAQASVREMVKKLSTTGSINSFADAAVVSEVAGTIEELLIERGQTVERGQVIAVVEHAEASARLQEAEAGLQAAEAQLLQARAKLRNVETEHARVTTLFADGVASQQMLDEIDANRDMAVAAKEVALAHVAQARAALQQATVFLENHTIRAPIGGIIVERHVDAGDKNNPSEPIVTIAQLDPVRVQCDFPECDLPLLRPGQKSLIEVDAYPGETFPAEVKIVSPCIDAGTRTVGVELWAPNEDGRLRAGMFARVTVVGEPFEALAVPDDALTRIPGTGVEFVFLVNGNTARRTDLKTGYRAEGWTEVAGDLDPGDRVVIEGQNNLKSGSTVRIVSTTVN